MKYECTLYNGAKDGVGWIKKDTYYIKNVNTLINSIKGSWNVEDTKATPNGLDIIATSPRTGRKRKWKFVRVGEKKDSPEDYLTDIMIAE